MANGFFGPFGDRLEAASTSELRARLAEIDTAVPRRTEGRTTADRERYCVVHYLRTLEQHGLLEFPLKVVNSERPDLLVDMGSRSFGIEVTEAGSVRHQRAMTYLESSPPGSILMGGKIRAAGESFDEEGERPPFVGDEPERFWTEDVLREIRRKTAKLSGYQDLPEYQLLIYDNTELVDLTAWSVTELPGRLAAAIRDWREGETAPERAFSRISVLRDRVLMYDVTESARVLPVPPSETQPSLLPLTRLGVAEEDVQSFCHRHHIRKLGFFGSAREERFGPQSDVDVLVEFEPGQRVGLIRLSGLELELGELLGRKADLRTVGDLSRYFRDEVVREKTDLVYAAG